LASSKQSFRNFRGGESGAGFSDISHFNRPFRSRFGDTPKGVRAQSRAALAAGKQERPAREDLERARGYIRSLQVTNPAGRRRSGRALHFWSLNAAEDVGATRLKFPVGYRCGERGRNQDLAAERLHSVSMRATSLTAGPMTVKSRRSTAPTLP
jgi:hypothetical protein